MFHLYSAISILANTESCTKKVSRASLCHQRSLPLMGLWTHMAERERANSMWLVCCIPGLLIIPVSHFPNDRGSRLLPANNSTLNLLCFFFRRFLAGLMQPLLNRSKTFYLPSYNPSKLRLMFKLFVFCSYFNNQ